MMAVPIEDLEALRLRGSELAGSQILPCQRYQHFGFALQGWPLPPLFGRTA
jgi:hypothetical protein